MSWCKAGFDALGALLPGHVAWSSYGGEALGETSSLDVPMVKAVIRSECTMSGH